MPTLEDKVRGVHIDENADGVPQILFTTSKDTYIVTFGEALEWWRQSDETYHRHPL